MNVDNKITLTERELWNFTFKQIRFVFPDFIFDRLAYDDFRRRFKYFVKKKKLEEKGA